jgi:hypothetical protein
MTVKSLFSIILKVLGLFFIKDFLALIPQLLASLLFLTDNEMRLEAVWSLLSTALIIVVYWFVCYYLIFKTDQIISVLQLDKGFDTETIPLNIHRATILSIAIIVIGGYLVIDELPNFCHLVYLYFQENRMTHGLTQPTSGYFILSGVKIVIGIILMVGQRQIVNLIELKSKSQRQ